MKFAMSLILGLEKATSIVNYFAFPLRIEKKKLSFKKYDFRPCKKKKKLDTISLYKPSSKSY